VTPQQCPSQYATSLSETHAFDRAGTFRVAITLYDANFDWVIATALLTVAAPQFTVQITSVADTSTPNGTTSPVEGLPTAFSAGCTPAANCANIAYLWNFGDGGVGNGLNPTHYYQLGGNYVVTLTGSDVTTGIMNRSFAVVNVTNLAPFGAGLPFVTSSLGPAAGSLQGPLPAVWYYSHSGFRTIEQTGGPILTVTAGSSVNFCTLAFDTSPIDAQNLTFRWHFSNASNPYSYPVLLANAPLDATQTCEPNGYIGYPYSFQSPLRPAELTTMTHTFLCPGFYNVTVSAWDPEGLHNSTPSSAFHYGVWVRGSVEVHAVNLTGLPQSQIPAYSTPIGQVAYPNAQDVFGNAPDAFWNYTWNAGKLGTTWGDVGRDTSYKATSQRVGVTAQVNSTALPCCNPHAVNSQTWTNFTNVAPTVGIDSFYSEASIQVTIQNPYYYNNLNITLLENNRNEGWYNMSYSTDYNQVTFLPIDFQLSDQWIILLNYTPYGNSGGTYVNIQWNWQYDDSSTDNYDATESDAASDTTSIWFSNSNTTKQNEVPTSVNVAAVGEPFTTYVVFFSPGQTNLTENWTMGDGTVYHTHDNAPRTPGPILSTWYLSYAYDHGANYNFNVTVCDDHHWCRGDQISVYNINRFWVNDTAPFISLNNSATFGSSTVPGVPYAVTATVYNQDNTTGAATVWWGYGDQQSSSAKTSNADGDILYTTHVYRYSFSQYLIVVYADSKNGSASANYTFVNVGDPAPIASYSVSPAPGIVGQPVNFNGEASQSSGGSAVGLAFGWLFGDGNSAGGEGTAAEMVSNAYANTGTYTSTLTVETDEGRYAYARQSVTINSATVSQPYPYLTNQTNVTADMSSWFTLHVPSGSNLAGVVLLNATWYWADGSYPTYGRSVVHTFLEPGNYNVSARVTAPNFGSYWAHALVHVQDGVPLVDLEFQYAESYGQIHATNLTALVLGDYADQWKVWHFTWAWGDGSSWYNTTGTLSASTVHTYSLAGPLNLTVNVSGPYRNSVYPWSKLGAPNATASTTLLSVPNVDGDGIPDAYAAAVLGSSAVSTDGPNVPTGQFWGSLTSNEGCTWYVGATCTSIPGIGSFSGDITGCGLTNIQQILGTVTGFYSDPLQCSQAGDNITNARHIFTSQYVAPSSAFFGAGNTTVSAIASEPVPGVGYGGPAIAFNQSALTIQLNTTSLGQATVYVQVPTLGWVQLGSPTTPLSSFILVRQSALTGISSAFGVSVSNFLPGGSWAVGVVDPSGSASGSIVSATISVTYYTNPAVADPNHQGMVEGNDVTVPIFNCAEGSSASFSQFNPATYTTSTITYYPYSLQYFKLSVMQGVPYVFGHNTYLGSANNGTSGCPVQNQPWAADTATYLGDAEFGIAPWNAHAAGDLALTNGMKALGSGNYQSTRGQYLTSAGSVCPAPLGTTCSGPFTYDGYPADPLASSSNPDALGPLNPTSFSTAGDGIADSQAIDPTNAIGLEVTITQATDPNCYLGSYNVLGAWTYTPSDIAETTFQTANSQNEPTIYTPAAFTSNGNSGGCTGGSNNFVFNFGSSSFFPIADSPGSYSFNFALWQNNTLTAQPSRLSGSSTITLYQACNVGCATANLPSGFSGSIAVVKLQRANVVLVNGTNEILNMPGYGYRFEGEQKFYSFDFNMGSGTIPAPFVQGLNVLLESRQALLNSSLNGTLQNGPSSISGFQGCSALASSTFTSTTSSGAAFTSSPSIQLTISGDLSSSPACVSPSVSGDLWSNLIPVEYGKTHGGEYVKLSTLQFELLGLQPGALLLSPWIVPTGFNSPGGTPPTNFVSQVTTVVENALNAIANSIIALGNFLASLPSLVQAFGQAILGALSAAVNAIEQAATWIVKAFEALFLFLIKLLEAVFQFIINGIETVVKSIAQSFALPFLSELYDAANPNNNNQGYLSLGDFQGAYGNAVDVPPTPPLPVPTAGLGAAEQGADAATTGLTGGIQVADDTAMVIIDTTTADAAAPVVDAAADASKRGLKLTIENAGDLAKTAGNVISAGSLTATLLLDFNSGNSNAVLNDLTSAPVSMTQNGAKEIADTLSLITHLAYVGVAFTFFNVPAFYSAFLGLKLAIISMFLDTVAWLAQGLSNTYPVVGLVLGLVALIFSLMGIVVDNSFQAQIEGGFDQVDLIGDVANAVDAGMSGAEIGYYAGKLVCGGYIVC
jgi:hypothetical protein